MYYKYSYINGNYIVYCTKSGKTREYVTLRFGEDFEPNFPDSIDLKITNKCSIGCSFCHESSNPNGKSFNIENTKKMLSVLPGGIEIAIGGGNIFDCYQDFKKLLIYCKEKNFYTRATINIKDLFDPRKQDIISNELFSESLSKTLLGAVGLSILNFNEVKLYEEKKKPDFSYKVQPYNTVFHIILGIFPVDNFLELMDYCLLRSVGILILGLKQFGRASSMDKPKDLDKWRNLISKTIYESRVGFNKLILGMDNLAIEQLQLKNMFTEKEWQEFYLGNEFSHSMYVDAVEETFAPTSRSPKSERVSWKDVESISKYFKDNHKSWS